MRRTSSSDCVYDGNYTVSDWAQQRLMRHRRVHEKTSDHSGYFERCEVALRSSRSGVESGVCAAWSEPFLSKDEEVLGTFCVSYAMPRNPDTRDIELIEAAGNIARIAIERERHQEALKQPSRTSETRKRRSGKPSIPSLRSRGATSRMVRTNS